MRKTKIFLGSSQGQGSNKSTVTQWLLIWGLEKAACMNFFCMSGIKSTKSLKICDKLLNFSMGLLVKTDWLLTQSNRLIISLIWDMKSILKAPTLPKSDQELEFRSLLPLWGKCPSAKIIDYSDDLAHIFHYKLQKMFILSVVENTKHFSSSEFIGWEYSRDADWVFTTKFECWNICYKIYLLEIYPAKRKLP